MQKVDSISTLQCIGVTLYAPMHDHRKLTPENAVGRLIFINPNGPSEWTQGICYVEPALQISILPLWTGRKIHINRISVKTSLTRIIKPVTNPHLVLFLCSGNYYRSRYAELYFLSRIPVGSGWSAESRGFRLSPENVGSIAPVVMDRLGALGIPLPSVIRPPRLFTQEEVRQADIIIALNEDEHRPMVERLLPDVGQRIVYWQIPDVEYLPPEQAFPLIERQVDELIPMLADKNFQRQE